MGTEWKLAQEMERIEKHRDPSPYRAPAKRAREASPRERNPKRRYSSGERIEARERSRERVVRERSREKSRERGARNKSRDRSRERVVREKSRERGGREQSRESVTARRPKTPPRTYATEATKVIYSRSSAIAKDIKLCTYCGKRHMASCALRIHPDANDDTTIEWADSAIGKAILAA